jgi:hypothetical protein
MTSWDKPPSHRILAVHVAEKPVQTLINVIDFSEQRRVGADGTTHALLRAALQSSERLQP